MRAILKSSTSDIKSMLIHIETCEVAKCGLKLLLNLSHQNQVLGSWASTCFGWR